MIQGLTWTLFGSALLALGFIASSVAQEESASKKQQAISRPLTQDPSIPAAQ